MTTFSKDKQPSDEVRKTGRAKRQVMTDALMLALNREVEDSEGKPTKRINQIAEKLVCKAGEDGDTQAIKEIFDRTEGKAMQALEIGGPDGGPVNFTTIYETKPD